MTIAGTLASILCCFIGRPMLKLELQANVAYVGLPLAQKWTKLPKGQVGLNFSRTLTCSWISAETSVLKHQQQAWPKRIQDDPHGCYWQRQQCIACYAQIKLVCQFLVAAGSAIPEDMNLWLTCTLQQNGRATLLLVLTVRYCSLLLRRCPISRSFGGAWEGGK